MNNSTEEIEQITKESISLKDMEGGEVLDIFIKVFGKASADDLNRIYTSVWGCDAYRFKDQAILGNQVKAFSIMKALVSIHESDSEGRFVASELCDSIRYSYGTTTDENYMKPINELDVFTVAALWKDKIAYIVNYNSALSSPTFYKRIWGEWNTYLELINNGRIITQNPHVDTFDGISEESIKQYRQLHTSLSESEANRYLSTEAHTQYERADLVGLCAVFKIMRLQVKDIKHWIECGNWEMVFCYTIRANLYGEGRFHQNVQMILTLSEKENLKKDFNALLSEFIQTLQSDYRTLRNHEDCNFELLFGKYDEFLRKYQNIQVPNIQMDDFGLIYRQQQLRIAENHLWDVEKQYDARDRTLSSKVDPVQIYSNAMNAYVNGIDEPDLSVDQLKEQLKEYRKELILARHMADKVYLHDYYFWTGFGDEIGQVKSRSLHPRVQLYLMEAYAERIFLAGKICLESLIMGKVTSVKEEYLRLCELDERTLYVQEWITNYGARRSAIFGYESVVSIEENIPIVTLDAWVFKARQILLDHGIDQRLWGPLATGYTERLRFLLKPGNGFTDAGMAVMQNLLNKAQYEVFSDIVRKLNPYDHATDERKGLKTPYITAGLHIHNVNPTVIFETMAHLKELDWPVANKWCLVGTTTTKLAFAKTEHQLALDMGISRLGIVNRQLLKGGNQNRIMPNVVKKSDREIFYFTIDDDYVASPQTLHRLSAILSNKSDASYSQTPLFFRAIYEPGHSIGRHLDGTMLLTWSTNVVPSFNNTSFFLPLGTGTLFRITPGKNDLEMTGGMVVDPKSVMSGEDWAYGTVSMLMRFIPQQFAETFHLPEEELLKRKNRSGYYITEDWVVGDGVDFAPGSQRQKARWNETCTRIFRSFWLPAILKNKGIGDMDHKSFHIVNYYMIASWLSHILSPLIYFVIPLLAFTPNSHMFDVDRVEYTIAYWAIFVSWVFIRTYLRRPAYRLSGIPFFEVINYVVMLSFGTFWSYFKTSVLSFVTKPEYHWKTYKGKQTTTSLKVFHICLALFHLSAAVFSIYNDCLIFTWYLLTGFVFLYVLRFHENAATDQKDKINKITRDVRVGFWKKISMRISGQTGILGLPITIDKSLVRNLNIVIVGELLFFLVMIIGIRYFTENHMLINTILSGYLFLVVYLGYKRLKIQKQAFEKIDTLKYELGAANSELMQQKVKSILLTYSA